MDAVTNINTNSKNALVNGINPREKNRRVRGAAEFNDAVAQGDDLIELQTQTERGQWRNMVSEELILEKSQIHKYIAVATNKDYLANSQSTGSLTLEAADKLIKEKNKAEKEAKLKAEGKPIPEKKPKKKKSLKEVGLMRRLQMNGYCEIKNSFLSGWLFFPPRKERLLRDRLRVVFLCLYQLSGFNSSSVVSSGSYFFNLSPYIFNSASSSSIFFSESIF